MKKLSLYIFLLLSWCNVSFSNIQGKFLYCDVQKHDPDWFKPKNKNMRQDKIYGEVEALAKSEKIMEKRYGVESFKDEEPYFTTSEETDIWELIRDGLTSTEIISKIKQW